MVGHSEFACVIDATGHTRYVLGTGPGPGPEATGSSFGVVLAGTINGVIGPR